MEVHDLAAVSYTLLRAPTTSHARISTAVPTALPAGSVVRGQFELHEDRRFDRGTPHRTGAFADKI